MLTTISIVIILVILNSAGQVFLKKAAIAGAYKLHFLTAGYSAFLVSVLLTQILLKFIEFKSLAIVITLNLVGVMLASVLFLNERFTQRKVFGTFLVVLGSMLFLGQDLFF
ncbi:MAG: drug/metabolite transporter (DMT)-like permease [Oleiphilaceae bacterium]|jgi:drug/metabolite transporter (DMT)-like permease